MTYHLYKISGKYMFTDFTDPFQSIIDLKSGVRLPIYSVNFIPKIAESFEEIDFSEEDPQPLYKKLKKEGQLDFEEIGFCEKSGTIWTTSLDGMFGVEQYRGNRYISYDDIFNVLKLIQYVINH